ncbi:MAG: hypothetical protein E7564_10700 [Ruminococcaceae bacterium]|nr:hypothetical protein [Oscillospiraceae bacterium]
MAKLEKNLSGDFYSILRKIEDGILNGSYTASLEEKSDYSDGKSRCSIRVFERYSAFGGNRVSLSVTLYKPENGSIKLCAVTSGGSTAMFFKLNTFGEDAFLEKLNEIL